MRLNRYANPDVAGIGELECIVDEVDYGFLETNRIGLDCGGNRRLEEYLEADALLPSQRLGDGPDIGHDVKKRGLRNRDLEPSRLGT